MKIIRWSCGSGAGTISHQTPGSNALAPDFQLERRLCLGPEVINMLFWMYFDSRLSLVIERLGRTRVRIWSFRRSQLHSLSPFE